MSVKKKAKYEVIDGVRYRNGEAMIPQEVIDKEYLEGRGKVFAKKIKNLRLRKKISQITLAKKSKVPKSVISQIERAKKIMSINEAKRIAKVYRMSAEALLLLEF